MPLSVFSMRTIRALFFVIGHAGWIFLPIFVAGNIPAFFVLEEI